MSADPKNQNNKEHKARSYPVSEPGGLLDFLRAACPAISRNAMKSMLKRGQIQVDGVSVTQFDYALKPGQAVGILKQAPVEHAAPFPIVYEDDAILVVEKPAGLLSIATEGEKQKTAYRMLMDYVRQTDPKARIFIVHRLDRDTSGLMLFAKDEKYKRTLQENWREYLIDRGYTAMVEGRVKEPKGIIRSYLAETKTHLMYSVDHPGKGQEAITHYQVIKAEGQHSTVELRLETGRKNQIRVHMADLGHPIVGDKQYGAKSNPIGRLALHAHLLAFRHPVSGETLSFTAPAPKSFF